MRPTARTLQYLEKRGHLAGVVERFNAHAGPFGQRFDLFGLFDVIAVVKRKSGIADDIVIVGIQCCGSDRSAHERKMLNVIPEKEGQLCARDKLRLWLDAG